MPDNDSKWPPEWTEHEALFRFDVDPWSKLHEPIPEKTLDVLKLDYARIEERMIGFLQDETLVEGTNSTAERAPTAVTMEQLLEAKRLIDNAPLPEYKVDRALIPECLGFRFFESSLLPERRPMGWVLPPQGDGENETWWLTPEAYAEHWEWCGERFGWEETQAYMFHTPSLGGNVVMSPGSIVKLTATP